MYIIYIFQTIVLIFVTIFITTFWPLYTPAFLFLNMAHGTRTVYPVKWNKGLSSTFQPPEEGWSVQRSKRCDKHGDKDEVNSPKNVNNISTFDGYLMANLVYTY